MRKYYVIICLLLTLYSCIRINPSNKPGIKDENEYFDFNTTEKIYLSLDYGFDNYSFLFDVYAENPLDQNLMMKESVKPIFRAFTDDNSSFVGTIEVSLKSEKLYICSEAIGVPFLTEIQIIGDKASYVQEINRTEKIQPSTLDAESPIGNNKRVIDAGGKLFALYNQYQPEGGAYPWMATNSNVLSIYSQLNKNDKISQNSTIVQLFSRLNQVLNYNNNENLVQLEEYSNIKLKKETQLDFIFLQTSSTFHNVIGYYYYKTGTNPTPEDIKAFPKFIIHPRVISTRPGAIIKTRLQFFGDDGMSETGTDVFPNNYTIGFVMIPSILINDSGVQINSPIEDIERLIKGAYVEKKRAIYTNKSANKNGRDGVVVLNDKVSGKLVYCMEDRVEIAPHSEIFNYRDMIFYIDSKVQDAIEIDSNLKTTDPNENQVETLYSDITYGTYAFEDQWPTGGDYDMNDVVVEYETEIFFNSANKIKKIVDKIKAVHDGASTVDAFGYVIEGELGTVDMANSTIIHREEENQFILFDNINNAIGNEYKLTRNFTSNEPIKNTYIRNYNPFVVPGYQKGLKNRCEVHLPKTSATSWINPSFIGLNEDAYYVRKDGKYPFAINLQFIKNFVVVSEYKCIGSPGEYPEFNSWVDSFGKTNQDWYNRKE